MTSFQDPAVRIKRLFKRWAEEILFSTFQQKGKEEGKEVWKKPKKYRKRPSHFAALFTTLKFSAPREC